uniref:Reverse transcriptase domain-containing protein n=1 Tax=Eptatretus burgeri TaxID=7764 RepID=A0A8C4NFK3_EPTBU
MLAAYVDLCKVFDSVNRYTLWRILGLLGVPPKLIDLMSELYSGTESAVRCGGTISDLFPVVTGVCQACVLALTLFSTCIDWILRRMSERRSCGASFGNAKISDLDFADDAVIFAETSEILLGALQVVNEESEPPGLRVSWVNTKIQAFNDILDAAVLSVPVCVEVVERFTYLGSDIHISAGCESEVKRCLGRAWEVMDSLDNGVWHCRYLCGRTKVWVFSSLVLPVLLYGCETLTLTRDLRRRINSFGSRSIWRILGYRWSDFVSNKRLLRETEMRFICIVRERQLRLYGHVAHFPDADPTHQILLAKEPCAWRRPMGQPHASWLQQVDRHLKEMGMGQASAWEMARRRPLEY